MKTGIHPTWFHDTKVTCACGASFITGSTHQTLSVDICSKCHPFFTGELRFVDRQGRVDKFMQRMQLAAQKKAAAQKAQPKANPAEAAVTEDPKSYQDILREQQAKLRKSKKATPAE